MHQQVSAFARNLFVCLFLVLCCASNQARSQSSAVTNGVKWLVGQVQSNGSLLNEQESVATKLQVRTEAAQTLKLLSSSPDNLLSAIGADPESNTEFTARKIIALGSAGWNISTQLTLLKQQQNLDGGFGGAIAYESTPLDTAWVILAMAQSNNATGDSLSRACNYLINKLNPDGGIAGRTELQRIHLSAISLLALQSAANTSVEASIKALASWLQLHQSADGSWGGNLYQSALSIMAIAPTTPDTSIRNNAQNFLLSKQQADGSWNSDAFLTSVVLRALSSAGTSSTIKAGSLKGQLIDSVSNRPLGDVKVSLIGPVTQSINSDLNGSFFINGLPAGKYTVAYDRAGYSSLNATYSLLDGQAYDVGTLSMVQLTGQAIIRGQILAAASSLPLAGVTVNVTGATVASAKTDSNGYYELRGIAPGSIQLSTTLTGYQSATGNAVVTGGQTLIFSPLLYANGQTIPTDIHLVGQIVRSVAATPIAGAGINLTGSATSTALSNDQGRFDLLITAGTYKASFSKSGYANASVAFVASAGGRVDLGSVVLVATLSKSSVKGYVFDAANKAIPGATVQLVGTTQLANTMADGSYALSDIAGNTASLRVSATGYESQILNLQIPTPADLQQNFILSTQVAGSLALSDVNVSTPSVGSNATVAATTSVKNTGGAVATAVLRLKVQSADRKRISTGTITDSAGQPVGQISLQANEQLNLNLNWNSAQNAPGSYQILIQIIEAGSITRETPLGKILSERGAELIVTGQNHFAGTVTANPPVLQAGTPTPVKLTAVLQNNGNGVIAKQSVTLNAVNTKDGSVAHSEQISLNADVAVNGLQALQFQDWVAPATGDYRLELVAADISLGKAIGTLYVGDSARAVYTANKQSAGAGTQTVRATVKVSGQDVQSGSISDPLAPLVKTAIQKAVTFNDREAVAWTNTNQCLGCHVQTQALVGGEVNRRFTNIDEGQRTSIYKYLKNAAHMDGSFYKDYPQFPRTASMLVMWGLDAWHDKNDVALLQMRGADYLKTMQLSDGHWDYDHPWLGQWTGPVDHTALNLKSLIGTNKTLAQVPTSAITTYHAEAAFPDIYSARSTGSLIKDAQDNIYLTSYDSDSVIQIKANGSAGMTWSGLSSPFALVVAKDGTGILVGTSGGLKKLSFDGSITSLNSNPDLITLKYSPDGILFAGSYNSGSIYQIDDDGKDSVYLPSGSIYHASSIDFNDDGEMLVTSPRYDNGEIYLVKKDKTMRTFMRTAEPALSINRIGDKWYVGSTRNFYRYDSQWQLIDGFINKRVDSVVQLQNGKILFVENTGYGINTAVADTPNPAAKITANTAAISRAADWLLSADYGSTADNLLISHQLLGLGEAARFYAADVSRRDALERKMATLAVLLKSRQLADGSWGVTAASAGDAFVTAHAGYALDYLNPSPSDPYIRKAVQWLLEHQKEDGSWASENGIFTTHLAATTWVSIWLPVVLDRLGGVDTDLSLSFPANVIMSNPDRVPAQTMLNSDGSTTVVWNMKGVTSDGQTLNFDAQLRDLQPNETRKLSTDAHLTFNNTFTGDSVNAAIDIPAVKVLTYMGLAVTTDKASYAADSPVIISGQVSNTGSSMVDGKLTFDILAPDNSVVQTIETQTFTNVAAGSSIKLNTLWNTGKSLAGSNYQARVSLIDSQGRVLTQERALFAITSTSTALTAKVSTDKTSYTVTDSVQLRDTISNVTQNLPVDNVQVVTTVNNPDGTVRFSKTETLAQLAAATAKDYTYSLPLSGAVAGTYPVKVVASSGSTVLVQASGSFVVTSSATNGSGLTGTLAVNPAQVQVGSVLTLNFSVNNQGNSALTNQALSVNIIDPASQKIIAQFPYTTTLAVGSLYNGNTTWTAAGSNGATYVATLSATFGANTINLAQASFTVAVPVVNVTTAIDTDKASYAPTDTVQLHDRITNVATSQAASNLQLVVTVKNPDGTTRFTKTETLSSLAASAVKDYSYSLSLSAAPAGQYSAGLVVSSGSTVVSQASAAFTVASTAATGSGLKGSISASTAQVPVGNIVSFPFSVNNLGNADLTDLPLTVSITEVATQKVIASFPYKTTLAMAALFNGTTDWTSAGTAGTQYNAVLSAKVGSTTLTLGQAPFSLIAPVVSLTVKQVSAPWQNVLVYSACKRAADELLGKCAAKAFPTENATTLAQCDTTRATRLDTALTNLGISHTVSTNVASFLSNLRSGQYNTYWISNGAGALQEPSATELLAAVKRGQGFMLDSLVTATNSQLTQCSGVSNNGAYATALQQLSLSGGIFSRADLSGPATQVKLAATATGVVEATLNTSGSSATPGIVSAGFGTGKTLAFGFDWNDTLLAQPADTRWPALIKQGLTYLTPAAADLTTLLPGDISTLTSTITNAGASQTLRIVQTLPAGAVVQSSTPAATLSSNGGNVVATWDITAASAADTSVSLRWKAPTVAGSYTANLAVSLVNGSTVTAYKTQDQSIKVQNASQLNTQLISQIQGLNLTTALQLAQRTAILASLADVSTALNSNSMDKALRILLTVQTRVKNIETGVGPVSQSLASLIAVVGRQNTH